MASALDTGHGTVRDLTGQCDLCGHECHCDAEICVALSCQRCESKLYHQGCVEKYLKKIGLAATRKIGFPCPFGKGKVTTVECKGRVEKAHPILPKNERKKQQRVAPQMLEAMAKQPKAPKPPAPAPKPPAAKTPSARKLNPPKTYTPSYASSSRSLASPSASAGSSGVWGSKGAGPVLASAHLPEPSDDAESAAGDSLHGGPRPAQLPVGLVLEEALSKAQRKNLARKKKRQAAGGLESASQTSEEHQELIAAALLEQQAGRASGSSASSTTTGSGSSSAAAAAASAGMLGFDGAAHVMSGAQHDVLVQQGHKFITDPAQYAALLGLYMGEDSDDDEENGDDSDEEEEEQHVEQQQQAAVDAPIATTKYLAAAPHTHSPPAAPAAPAAPAPGKDFAGEATAFDAAVAASIQQYQLEEEIRKQREALVHGFAASNNSNSNAPSGYPGGLHAPVAAPVIAPVAVPVVAPVAVAPSAALYAAATKQQPDLPAVADYANNANGWVFGGAGNPQGALPPHIPAAYAAQYAATGAAVDQGGQGAGDEEDEDDDDLGTLLALCGVAAC